MLGGMPNARLSNLLGALAVGVGDEIDAAVWAKVGLRGSALAALLTIFTRPGDSVDALARTLGLSHSATVRAVDRLAKDGLVARGIKDSDRRAAALTVTRSGATTARAALATRRSNLDKLLSRLGNGEREVLEEVLGKVLETLPGGHSDATRICRFCEHAVCRGDRCPVGSAASAITGS
jgi:MarR family transcriptional repressor of emrRAB